MACGDCIEPGVKYLTEFVNSRNGAQRLRTICTAKITIDHEHGGSEVYYAYGSTICSVKDEPNKQAGENISLKRAWKALNMFAEMDYDFKRYNANAGFEGTKLYKPWMNILTPEEFGELEKHILEEDAKRTDVAAFFDSIGN